MNQCNSKHHSDTDETSSRRYICTSCDTIVRARWHPPGGFNIGCDCTTVPVVPQMGQSETPDNWRVERPDCCSDVDVSSLDTAYGNDFADYTCLACGAKYAWDGAMVESPDHAVDEDHVETDVSLSDYS